MRDRILQELRRLEAEEEVRVLFAVESGSRAWGFASRDSDWDVRFVYLRRPEWYLSIHKRRDVIERPIVDELDLSGWDLSKALHLFRKCNPPLLEWLRSPIIYAEHGEVADRLRALEAEYFRPRPCMYHYLSMAKKNYREYLRRERVRAKKYFYVLRPVLACGWIDRFGSPPPMEFARLLDSEVEDAAVRAAIDDLLARKAAGNELDDVRRVQVLNRFIEDQLADCAKAVERHGKPALPSLDALDELFREALRAEWP